MEKGYVYKWDSRHGGCNKQEYHNKLAKLERKDKSKSNLTAHVEVRARKSVAFQRGIIIESVAFLRQNNCWCKSHCYEFGILI